MPKLIKLSQNKYTIVDDEDYEYLNQWKWHVQKNRETFYAVRNSAPREDGTRTQIRMHRLIMGLTNSEILCDHKDHNGLNNKKVNLRTATVAQNNYNSTPRKNSTSKYLGVNWKCSNKKWVAQIRHNGVKVYLGIFESEIDAAVAYNRAAIKLFGEYANLNKIE